jgi:hypothetical protein
MSLLLMLQTIPDFQAFRAAFARWVEQALPRIEGEWYAVDGKSLKATLKERLKRMRPRWDCACCSD